MQRDALDLTRLRPTGGKHSSKRDQILRIFLQQEGHLSADDLFDLVRRQAPGIGRATVYRTLQWMVEAGSPWQVEGPTIMAAYGLGLQGWSAVNASAMADTGFTPTVQAGNVYNGNTPAQLVLYPALARMVLRGDVKQGGVISTWP